MTLSHGTEENEIDPLMIMANELIAAVKLMSILLCFSVEFICADPDTLGVKRMFFFLEE